MMKIINHGTCLQDSMRFKEKKSEFLPYKNVV